MNKRKKSAKQVIAEKKSWDKVKMRKDCQVGIKKVDLKIIRK
jgi:hypothetical protein